MGDERIPTTERHAALREQVASDIATADGYNPAPDPALWELDRGRYLALADAVLPFIEQARKQGWHEAAASYNEEVIPIERADAVEGLVATIKALPARPLLPGGPPRWFDANDVLAVVEAARGESTHAQ